MRRSYHHECDGSQEVYKGVYTVGVSQEGYTGVYTVGVSLEGYKGVNCGCVSGRV